ncbi:MAG: dicarboxylate/amino acid:cation symporter [Planctomycetales bacterium]|nr:dicarboxylate/amino acid:cation symporter [Planctomycetales bacterium]
MTETSPHNGADNGEKRRHNNRLTLSIVVAIIAAIVLALAAPSAASKLHLGGEVFLRLLQMVVVPLVMASVMSGILGLGDVRRLGRPGFLAVAYYMCTTVLAVLTGLVVVNVVKPGVGIDKSLVEDAYKKGAGRAEDVSKMGGSAKTVVWDQGLTSQRTQAGPSDPVEVPHGKPMDIKLTITQIGDATAAAVATVETSSDGKEYSSLKSFDGPEQQGKVKHRLELPKDAHYVRVNFQPQEGGDRSAVAAEVIRGPPTMTDIFENLVLMLFTNNLLGAMVSVNLLPLIVFSIVFAGMLTTMGNNGDVIRSVVISINEALLNFILLLMNLAPLGIFCLVAARFGEAQQDGSLLLLLKTQAWYMTTVLSGLGVHAFVTLPLVLFLLARRSPIKFMTQMSQAVLTAFSTASSTATLPVSMECAEKNANVSKRSTEFVLPLGATINMDGTALYEAAAAIFIAQAYAIVDPSYNLGLAEQALVAVTATLAAVGAAGIPEAGLVTLLIVLNAVNLPLELIGLVLPVDWLLDRFRTAVNVFGDAVGAAVVDGAFEAAGEQSPKPAPQPAG